MRLFGDAPVSLGVNGHYIHGNVILFERVQVSHFYPNRWKHSPAKHRIRFELIAF